MPNYKMFKVVIENEEHLAAVESELKRLGYKFDANFAQVSKKAPTCVTVWEEGDYHVWSMPVSAKTYQHHNITLRLAELVKMTHEDVVVA